SYQEVFRLPARYDGAQLADLLKPVAELSNAGLAKLERTEREGVATFHLSFAFDSRWVPVQLNFEGSAGPKICLVIDDGGYQKGEALQHLYGFKVPVT